MKRLLKPIAVAAFVFAALTSLPAAEEEAKSPLGKQMETMNRSFRKVRRQYADPAQKDANLALIDGMLENVKTAKTLPPPGADRLAAEEREKYLATFQKQLDQLAKEYGALKEQIAAGNAEGAGAEIKKIGELRDQSHKDLGVDLDKK